MAINYRKLKKQINSFTENGKKYWRFTPTDEQPDLDGFCAPVSKRRFMKYVGYFLELPDYRKEFEL